MSDQSKLGLGRLITTPQQRDAIHIAVAPIVAREKLLPGAHVNAQGESGGECIGIVDPFLTHHVERGQKFWLYLYPGTITSLRHLWSHPSFTESGIPVASASEKWLREFAASVGADYLEMMEVAQTHCEGENTTTWGERYLCDGGRWEGQSTPDEFWEHFTNVTNKKPDEKYGKPGIFSCSC